LTGNLNATAEDGIGFLDLLCKQLKIPNLSVLGLKNDDDLFNTIAEKSSKSSSMTGNCVALDLSQIKSILLNAL